MKTLTQTTFLLALMVGMTTTHASPDFTLFGDLGYQDGDGSTGAFGVGSLDFFSTGTLGEDAKTDYLVELIFEASDNTTNTDLERIWVGYTFSDQLAVRLGRMHTPIGYWNRNFHHGQILQDTATRPFFLDFEDGDAGVLPVHIAGTYATGSFLVSGGELGYEAWIANGSSIDTDNFGFAASATDGKPELDINFTSDPNSNKMVGGRIKFSPSAFDGQFSVFGYSQKVAESGTGLRTGLQVGDTIVQQNLIGADLNVVFGAFNLLGEGFRWSNDNKIGDGATHHANAYYLQAGWRFTDEFKLILRHSDLNFSRHDAFFQLLGSEKQNHTVAALRWDLNDQTTVKFQVEGINPDFGKNETRYFAQVAFVAF